MPRLRRQLISLAVASVAFGLSTGSAAWAARPADQSPVSPPPLLTLVGSTAQAVASAVGAQSPLGSSGPASVYAPGDRVDFQYAGCVPDAQVTLGLYADPTLKVRVLEYPKTWTNHYGVVRSAILLPIDLPPGAYVFTLTCNSAEDLSTTASTYLFVAFGRNASSWGSTVGGWVALSPVGSGPSAGLTPLGQNASAWQLIDANGTRYLVTPLPANTVRLAHTGITLPVYLSITLGAIALGGSLLMWTRRRRARVGA